MLSRAFHSYSWPRFTSNSTPPCSARTSIALTLQTCAGIFLQESFQSRTMWILRFWMRMFKQYRVMTAIALPGLCLEKAGLGHQTSSWTACPVIQAPASYILPCGLSFLVRHIQTVGSDSVLCQKHAQVLYGSTFLALLN